MKKNELIIVFNVLDERFDAYKDYTQVSTLVNIPRTTLQDRLSKGVIYKDRLLIGIGTYNRSGRGKR